MLTEEQGIQAIMALQAGADIVETEEQAKAGWNKMSEWEKRRTENVHRIICGGFEEEKEEEETL